MGIFLSFKMAFKSIADNKSRSALTMLGVIIGVCAVIVAVGFAQSCSKAVTGELESMGSNTIMGMISSSSSSRKLTLKDCEEMENSSQYIAKVSPYIIASLPIKHGAENKTARVYGTDEDYMSLEGLEIEYGRNFNSADIESNQRVAIIGVAVINKIFDGDAEGAVGQSIKVNGNSFKVIGTIKSVSNGMEGTNDDAVIIPIKVAQRVLKISSVTMFVATSSSDDTLDLATKKIQDFLEDIFKDGDRYAVFTSESMLSIMDTVTGVLMLILASVATISLVVGGIGIMNIMLVSVSERTREIGIRKAIGAKRHDILTQFLIESLVLTTCGGVIGIVIALLIITYGIGSIDLLTPVYSVEWTVGAFVFSMVIGVVFGIFPANKAAKLNPIDALHND